MARTCASCQGALSDGARFCRACGAPAPAEADAEPTVVLPPDDPRCRSCGADLAANARFCRSCGSERSDAPAAAEAETVAAPTAFAESPTPVHPAPGPSTAAAPPPPRAAPPPPSPPPAAPAERSRAGFVALVAVLVVVFGAIGGTAAYLLVLKPDDEPTRSVLAGDPLAGERADDGGSRDPDAGGGAGTSVPEGSKPRPEPAASPAPAAGALPDASEAELEDEIAALLLDFHEAVVDDRTEDAWDRLSSRKQRQIEREDGFAAWSKAQASLASHLDPSGLTVSIDSLDDAGGVARVRVDGMTWSDPDASCSEWSGLTWVKYEDGAWRYDPGYSTTAARERAWKPRFSELLGGSC